VTPLQPETIIVLQQFLACQQHRTHMFGASPLRVYVDGAERWQVDPRLGACEAFRIPVSAAYLDIFENDAEGALLLAIVPLPAPEDVKPDGEQHLSVTLEEGQTLTIDLALDEGSSGKTPAYVVRLAYTDAAMVAPRGAESPGVEPLLMEPHPEPSASGHAPTLDLVETRRLTVQQLLPEMEQVQAQASEFHSAWVHTQALRAMVKDHLQRLQQLSRETPWVSQRSQEQDVQGDEAPPQDGP
jgi:hypothetical protein